MAIISNAVTIADAGAFSASLGSMTHIKTITISSNTTELGAGTKAKFAELLAVKVLMRTIEPRLRLKAPASAIVTALEIIATIKPPLD